MGYREKDSLVVFHLLRVSRTHSRMLLPMTMHITNKGVVVTYVSYGCGDDNVYLKLLSALLLALTNGQYPDPEIMDYARHRVSSNSIYCHKASAYGFDDGVIANMKINVNKLKDIPTMMGRDMPEMLVGILLEVIDMRFASTLKYEFKI